MIGTQAQSLTERENASHRLAVVVGGGISGLTAAHRLVECRPTTEVLLLEAGHRLGGVLQTVRQDGFLIEQGADNWITNVPWADALCRRIGFDNQLIATNARFRRALVLYKGRLHRIPRGFQLMAPSRLWPVLATPVLSLRGKIRLACEPWMAGRHDAADESVATFATRRLGRETYERLVQPLIGGIYAGDPEQLSAAATVPRFVHMERQWGSVIRGMRHEAKRQMKRPEDSGARYGLFVAPRDGMSSFVDHLAARLPTGTIRLHANVQRIERIERKYRVSWMGANGAASVDADAVIVATAAQQAAIMLQNIDRQVASRLADITYAPSAIVVLAYKRSQIAHPLDAFGFVVPRAEKRKLLACSFSSVKYAGRAPSDAALLRVFLGGADQPELIDLSDARLTQTAIGQLRVLLGVEGHPVLSQVSRPAPTPQYVIGHCQWLSSLNAKLEALDGLELAGNTYGGIGIPFCVHSGERAAERVIGYLGRKDKQSGE